MISTNLDIADWEFDLSSPVYLIHPNYKFWEVTSSGKKLVFRVGKLRDGAESNIEETSKEYPSRSAAISSASTKI